MQKLMEILKTIPAFLRATLRRIGVISRPAATDSLESVRRLPFLAGKAIEHPEAVRTRVLKEARQLFSQGDEKTAFDKLRELERATVDQRTLDLTDSMLTTMRWRSTKRIATGDPARRAQPGEQVVVYGNYPYSFGNLLVNDHVKRHASWFWRIQHDLVESVDPWDGLDRIYVINMDDREDRLDAIMVELARARAPLDRVTRFSALVPKSRLRFHFRARSRGTIGCLMSHLGVLRNAIASGYRHVLVFEDDFVFTSDLDQHLADFGEFFRRKYDYWICLLATSKYDAVFAKDDLVSYTFQPCTTASAYLLSKAGMAQLLPIWEDALRQLEEGRDKAGLAADKAWAQLQPSGKFIVFNRKMGFQSSGYSSIARRTVRPLD